MVVDAQGTMGFSVWFKTRRHRSVRARYGSTGNQTPGAARVAHARAHSRCVKAGHVHALDHARYGALTVQWKDRLP
jgi:hypothetical protein